MIGEEMVDVKGTPQSSADARVVKVKYAALLGAGRVKSAMLCLYLLVTMFELQ